MNSVNSDDAYVNKTNRNLCLDLTQLYKLLFNLPPKLHQLIEVVICQRIIFVIWLKDRVDVELQLPAYCDGVFTYYNFLKFLKCKKIQFQTSSSQVNFCYFQGYIVIDSAEPAAINCNICTIGKENNMLVVKEFDSKELIFRIVA